VWVILNDSFLSIVASRDKKDELLVRGRRASDIKAVFPTATILATPTADYPFRTFLPRSTVQTAMSREVNNIQYPNFKASVLDKHRHDIYEGIWVLLHRLEKARTPTERDSNRSDGEHQKA
jgi:hypothetical protein